jgi:hypothetical protein
MKMIKPKAARIKMSGWGNSSVAPGIKLAKPRKKVIRLPKMIP